MIRDIGRGLQMNPAHWLIAEGRPDTKSTDARLVSS